MKNPYETLGIPKNSSEQEIKRAYRKKAMEWHPDKHKGDKKAEEKFKEINAAYEILGDTQKRKQYDQFGHTQDHNPFWGGSQGGFGQQFSGGFGGFEDLFSNFWGGNARGGRKKQADFGFDFADLFSGQQEETQPESLDVSVKTEIPFLDFLLGTSLSLETPSGSRVKITIPPLTKPGTKFRIAGKGKTFHRKTGDFFVIVDAKMPKEVPADIEKLLETIKYRL